MMATRDKLRGDGFVVSKKTNIKSTQGFQHKQSGVTAVT